jgi:hypothetical protein
MKEQTKPEPLDLDDSLPRVDPLLPMWSRRNWVHEEVMHLAAAAEAEIEPKAI